ncbi:integrase core domain-containing protein [Streptomyces monashensis]|uniref:integrase core domain-containing protein n=1 Tax=Streptomyces monashensis TaxID=1678012 RepID=UPI0033DAA6D6
MPSITVTKSLPRSPNRNPHAEQFVLSARKECTDRILIYDRDHAEKLLRAYEARFNRHRPHHVRDQLVPFGEPNAIPLPEARVEHHPAVLEPADPPPRTRGRRPPA